MMRPQFWTSAALALALAPACGDDTGSVTANNPTEGPDPTTTSEVTPTTESAESTATSEEPAQFQPTPALGGLEVEWVEANQGVGVAIGRDGAGIGNDRSTYLLQNRLTLVRAFWKQLPADWTPREIEARLIITGYPDGERVLTSRAMVEGASFVGNLAKSFYWGLMPEDVIPGLTYRIELWETEKGYAALSEPPPPGENPPRLPYAGNAPIGIETSYQAMKITIVPFHYNFGGCVTTPDLSESTMKKFEDYMFMMNPIEKLEITMHEPIEWEGQLTHFGQLNTFMVDLRQQDGAPPETYYFGLVDVCSGGLGGAGGQAIDIPSTKNKPSPSDAWKRISSGLSLPNNVEFSAETFVHEVGHTQGRYHIKCNGEAGTDGTYPHDGGDIGEWGFGIVNFKLYHPTVHKDYMTYCHPVWASTFGWNKVYPVIKELSLWEMSGPPAHDDSAILLGVVYPDGTESWITTPGAVDPDNLSAVQSVEFYAGGEKIAAHAAEVRPQPDSDLVNIVVPLPDGFDQVTQIARIADDQRTVTDAKSIQISHKYRPLKNK